MTRALFLILSLGFLFFCVSCQNQNSSPQSISILAAKLSNEYLDNKGVADAKYKGKVIKVGGYVEKAGEDFSKQAYVLLKTDKTVHRIKCILKTDQNPSDPGVIEGSFIFVTGQCDGELMGDVILKDCVIK